MNIHCVPTALLAGWTEFNSLSLSLSLLKDGFEAVMHPGKHISEKACLPLAQGKMSIFWPGTLLCALHHGIQKRLCLTHNRRTPQ